MTTGFIILHQINSGGEQDFWRDVWLIIISFLMFSGTIYIYFRLRNLNFSRVKKLLEERVEVKTRQLTEKNVELETLSLVASKTDNSVLVTSPTGEIEWFNDAFYRLTGIPTDKVIGKDIRDINVYSNIKEELEQALNNRHSRFFESNLTNYYLKNIWISTTLTPVYDEFNHLKKIVLIDTDITSTKLLHKKIEDALKEKDVLIKEIHHRVKNNLQIIISLLNLQSGYIKDELSLKAVKDGQNRVRSMALVHEKFYQSDELSEINFNEYLEKLCQFLYQSYGDKTDRINVTVTGDDVLLDMDTAMPCGLLVNEIVSNAYKYAFPAPKTGEIEIFLKKDATTVNMLIADNGVGLPESVNPGAAETLGMQLIQALTSQLDGELQVLRQNGTTFSIVFPYPKSVDKNKSAH